MRIALGSLAVVLTMLPFGTPATADAPYSPPKPGPGLEWQESVADADQSFRGLDAVDDRTAWASGASLTEGGPGKVFRSTDGGRSWHDVSPPETAGLNFRDVEAEDARTASVLAIGPGEDSRIYRTTNGGTTWRETFRNAEEEAFYNCMDFYPGGKRGLAVSDPVDGKFRIASTRDGGRSWQVMPDRGMPDSTGEFNFSASGDCLVIKGGHAWFGSGGSTSRVFHSANGGRRWSARESTIPAGESAGVFALAFRGPHQGVAVGGDFETPDNGVDASAYTHRHGAWRNGGDLPHLGEDVAWLPGRPGRLLVVGESGEDGGSSLSLDGGRSWRQFSPARFHTLDCARKTCWAAGGDGRVATLSGGLS